MKAQRVTGRLLRVTRGLAFVAAAVMFASGSSPALAAAPVWAIGTAVEPILCDTRDVSLNHRFSPIGYVELDTGAYVIDIVDIGHSGSGSRLFTRSYDSLDYRATLLGRGWTTNFDVRVSRTNEPKELVFTGPDGKWSPFQDTWPSKEVIQSSSSSAKMARTDDAGFIVTHKGSKWTINNRGTLVRVDYPGGEWVQASYNGGHLEMSHGPKGPELAFDVASTDNGDRLTRVTDETGSQGPVEFEFDETGRLSRATSSNREVRRYTYSGTSERIATITDDANNVLIAAEYDSVGRVVRLQDADGLRDGQAEVFAYEDLPDGGIRTTVTYPKSRVEPDWNPVQIATHDRFHQVTEEQLQPTSTETYVGRFYYDGDDQLSVDGIACPTRAPVTPADGPIAGPLGIFAVVSIRVLGFIAYVIQLVLDEVLPMISI